MPHQVDAVLLKDFNLIITGYYRRQDREWNQTRHLLSFIKTFGGMGGSEYTPPQDIWPLPMDTEDEVKMITSLKLAIELLNDFMAD